MDKYTLKVTFKNNDDYWFREVDLVEAMEHILRLRKHYGDQGVDMKALELNAK